MDEKGEVSSAEDLLKSIENDLEELDPTEYDLPKTEPPTLESILNENDADDTNPLEDQNEFGRLLGAFDTESLCSFDDPDRRRKRKVYGGHGSVMRHVKMKGVSSQLVSAQQRINAGLPTAMVVGGMIAVGTAHGIVYVFEPSQAMKWSLGSISTGHQYGAVSSLSFNVDCTRLLVGYAKGQITMWDLTNGKLLRTITDAHPLGHAVLHVKFTDSLTVALCCDSGGSVFDMEFTRGVTGRGCTSRCIFSGSRGEVCAIEPLHVPEFAKNNSNSSIMLVAMVTFTKVLVINLRPEVKIIYSFSLTGQSDCLPLISWRFAGVRVPGQVSVMDPVLAVARQSTFHFFQAIIKSNKDIQLQRLQTSELAYRLIAFCWLDSATIAALDTLEKVHFIDIRTWDELEVIDLSDMEFVYSTSFFKGLVTGGNVSPALSYAGDHACYYSMSSYHSQLFILGNKSVHAMIIRKWDERLGVLLRDNKHQEALALAFSFYDGTAKAVFGLPRDERATKRVVTEKMLEILYTYIDLSMTKLCPEFGRIDELIKHYEKVVPVCVDYCLRLDRVDVLFGRLYDRFSQDVIAHGAFLECLEPFILEDQLRTVSPQIIKDLTSHYQSKDMLSRAENCIVHLDIISLDIHETVKLCRQNGMYDAIIYIYNQGLQDFVSPLQELCSELRQAIDSGKQLSDVHVKLGNKLLVYVSNSLAGLAYPIGALPEHMTSLVKQTIFKTLTTLHSASAPEDEKIYPYLRTLLDFDTREFLNVLALAFEETDFGGSSGYQQRQVMVDILLQVMLQSRGYSPKQMGILFTFLARQVARHNSSIHLNRSLFNQVLEHLCKPGEDAHKEERQEALLELLYVEEQVQLDTERLLVMAEHARLFRVCEYIYKKKNLHDKILLTYINDPSRCHQAFTFIRSTLAEKQLSSLVHDKIREVTLANLVPLIACDPAETAQLLVGVLKADLLQTTLLLKSEPEAQYRLLNEIVTSSEASEGPPLDSDIYDIYVERMCIYDNLQVDIFIRSSSAYNRESIYKVCEKYHMYDSMTYLLEELGKVHLAFNMMLQAFQEKIDMYMERITRSKGTVESSNALDVLRQQNETMLLKLIGLCQRNSSKLSEQGRQDLWFPLLDAVVQPQQKLSSSGHNSDLFKELSKQVMTCMMGHVELPAMMSKIVGDFNFSHGKFGDVKDLVIGMLNTYNYENTLMTTVCSMLDRDLVNQLMEKRVASGSAFVPNRDHCGYCKQHATVKTRNPELRIFRCGHMFHTSCLDKNSSYTEAAGEGEEDRLYQCYICNKVQYSGYRVNTPSTIKPGVSLMNLHSTIASTSHTDFESLLSRRSTRRRHGQAMNVDVMLRLTAPSPICNDQLDEL